MRGGPLLDQKSEGCREPDRAKQPERIFLEHLRLCQADDLVLNILSAVKKIDQAFERSRSDEFPQIKCHCVDRKVPAPEITMQVRALEVREIELDEIAVPVLDHARDPAFFIEKEKSPVNRGRKCARNML